MRVDERLFYIFRTSGDFASVHERSTHGGTSSVFHFMRLGLTTEGAETPVRAARKEACERIRFAQLGRDSPTLDGRQMICGRGVDEWHEVRLPPSSFRAPRSGFPRFQWLTDLSTAPPASSAPLRQTGASTTRPSRHKWTLHFLFTPAFGARAALDFESTWRFSLPIT